MQLHEGEISLDVATSDTRPEQRPFIESVMSHSSSIENSTGLLKGSSVLTHNWFKDILKHR